MPIEQLELCDGRDDRPSVYASHSTLVLTQATDHCAGIRTGDAEFKLVFTGPDGLEARWREGDYEFSDGVDPREVRGALAWAVKRYALDSVRNSRACPAWCLLDRGCRYVVGAVYRAVLWAETADDGYAFSFMPERGVPRRPEMSVSAPGGAARYAWKRASAM